MITQKISAAATTHFHPILKLLHIWHEFFYVLLLKDVVIEIIQCFWMLLVAWP